MTNAPPSLGILRCGAHAVLRLTVCNTPGYFALLYHHQGNYAAANSALDMVAQQHRNEGRSHASVLWGPWAAGMAAQQPALLARFAKAGLGAIPPGRSSHKSPS